MNCSHDEDDERYDEVIDLDLDGEDSTLPHEVTDGDGAHRGYYLAKLGVLDEVIDPRLPDDPLEVLGEVVDLQLPDDEVMMLDERYDEVIDLDGEGSTSLAKIGSLVDAPDEVIDWQLPDERDGSMRHRDLAHFRLKDDYGDGPAPLGGEVMMYEYDDEVIDDEVIGDVPPAARGAIEDRWMLMVRRVSGRLILLDLAGDLLRAAGHSCLSSNAERLKLLFLRGRRHDFMLKKSGELLFEVFVFWSDQVEAKYDERTVLLTAFLVWVKFVDDLDFFADDEDSVVSDSDVEEMSS